MKSELKFNTGLNPHVVELVHAWKSNGSPQQEGFDWSSRKQNWKKCFPLDAGFISKIPKEVNRADVRTICDSTQYSIREKFLSVMIWGYGDRGYGPYRVTQMLHQEHAEDVLSEVLTTCQKGDPEGAYIFLKKNRIRLLGPSYSSKFIAFCTPRNIGAPIYDSYIALWVSAYALHDFDGVSTNSEVWNPKMYSRYRNWVKTHADELGCYPDDVELVLFRAAETEFSKTSNWSGK